MLISESEVCVDLESCGIFSESLNRPGQDRRRILVKLFFFNLCGHFQCERVQSLSEIANILQKLIVEMTAGIAAARPAAVVTRASAMPGAPHEGWRHRRCPGRRRRQ